MSPFKELFLGHFILYFLCRNYRVCLKWEGVLHGIVLTYHWGGWRPEEMGSYSALEATLAARQPPAPQSWGQILTQRQMVPSIRLCFCLSRRNMTLTISTCQSLLEGTLTTQLNFYPNCHIVLGSTLGTLRTFFKLGVQSQPPQPLTMWLIGKPPVFALFWLQANFYLPFYSL